ncbi:MAG: ComF family protein [Chitinophagales bacterium]|nr:ComF family protein [Chitinophagales bacterium]
MKNYIEALWQLFYPKICLGCANTLSKHEDTICVVCTNKLPLTKFYLHNENPLLKKFWGRVDLQQIDSLLYFEKNAITQDLLHQLKYNNKQEIGVFLSNLVLEQYKETNKHIEYNAIVCVPLHYKKQKRRGYNQCHSFCQNLSQAWNIPFYKHDLVRNMDTISQTGKNRIARWENVERIFSLAENNSLTNKHVLLVDDVLTTGATIEACAQEILKAPNTKVSVLTMACKI